jgi:polyisoprenoid-binding protein YceI
MRPMSRLVGSLTLLLGHLAAFGAQTLPIDPSHTAVIFSWNHRGFSHPVARLEHISGSVILDKDHLAQSSVSVTLPLSGLRTGDEFLDRRLKGAEFFDVANFSDITFKSSKIEIAGGDTFTIIGDLCIHGVTKSVILNATINKVSVDSKQKMTAGFDADVMLRRSDFGVSKYVPMVTDEISVHITLEAAQE